MISSTTYHTLLISIDEIILWRWYIHAVGIGLFLARALYRLAVVLIGRQRRKRDVVIDELSKVWQEICVRLQVEIAARMQSHGNLARIR
jgi:hypothetical protein